MQTSAGILVFRKQNKDLEVLLVHPGGPFWKNKDEGAWTIPKGLMNAGEEPLEAAKREFEEETGTSISGNFFPLQPVKQKAGKLVMAWAVEGTIDPEQIQSNEIKIEWPYKSGNWKSYPEVDKAGWFPIDVARVKMNIAQTAFLDELTSLLGEME